MHSHPRRRSRRAPRRNLCAPLCALLLGAGVTLAPPSARAQIGEQEAAARIAADYGVEVLRVRPGDLEGLPVWFVTVMRPGGDFNSAFQVTTLAVDRATGALVPAYRHGVSGARGTASATDTRIERRPDALRSGTWR